jgi:rare lipoprotein A
MLVTQSLAGAATGSSPVPAGTAVKLSAKRHLRVGKPAVIRGRVAPAGSRQVTVTVGGRQISARTESDGSFRVGWSPPGAGVYRARATVDGTESAALAHSKPVPINVYRSAAASYYGPGLYGGALACGGRLTPGKLGVANKSLPCGTHLTLRYGHRSVRVQVIDRGPYSGNREFDLTAATKARLGFPSTGTVLSTR